MNVPDTPPKAYLLQVDAPYHGQRIDNFLLRVLKGVPKSMIYRCLRKGEVRVNKGRVKPDHRLRAGDAVRIPPLRQGSAEAARPPEGLLRTLQAAVIHEDRELLVLNKPAGVAVHAGSGLAFGVIEGLRAARPDLAYLELAHRLDRETSGCLLLAKTPDALRAVQHALGAGTGEKRYLALARGGWKGGPRRVDAPLAKNQLRGGERMVTVTPDGKPARSRFTPLQAYDQATLLEVSIDTGRTHQIRVHGAHIGHPLAGDDKYGDEHFNRRMAALGLKRLFLHASALVLPVQGRELAISAPLDEALGAVLDRLEVSS